MLIVIFSISIVLYLALAIVLVRKYLRTRDKGFIWLGVAVIVWPLISSWLDRSKRTLIDHSHHGPWLGFHPFDLFAHVQMSVGSFLVLTGVLQRLIGVGLILIAVLYLYNSKRNRNSPAI